MVALKDKRKWTLTEYKGEHECCSGDDVSYHSFHDASRDVGCHSSTCATSSLFGGVWGFFFFFLPSSGDESNFLLFKVKKVGPLNTPRQENYRSNLWACFCAALCVRLLYNLLLYWRVWRACVCQGSVRRAAGYGKARDCDLPLLFLTRRPTHIMHCCSGSIFLP